VLQSRQGLQRQAEEVAAKGVLGVMAAVHWSNKRDLTAPSPEMSNRAVEGAVCHSIGAVQHRSRATPTTRTNAVISLRTAILLEDAKLRVRCFKSFTSKN